MNNKFEQPKKGSLSLQDLLQTVLHLISTKKFWIELFIMTFGMFIAALGTIRGKGIRERIADK